ncbi:MAG: hypothetical protein ABFE01_26510 [Phycisphaerales bacterium]|jgi:hypothetical protein
MHTQQTRWGVCFAAVLFSAAAGSAGRSSPDGNDLDALREEIRTLRQEMRESNDRNNREIQSLREEIDRLKQDPNRIGSEPNRPTMTQPGEPATAAGEDAPPAGPSGRIPQSFNPDISAIGDVLFHAGENEEGEHVNRFSLRELELALGAAVDPFGRADFFIALEEEEEGEFEADVEEGYFTFDTLPYDLKARAGKFYTFFGKANQFHTHATPWVDRPLMIRNFFGEEGMSEPGAELSWLVPNPWDQYVELIFQVQDNRNEPSFAGGESGDLMYVGHLKNFFDLDSDSSLEVGGSVVAGPNAQTNDGPWTSMEGVDVTYKWRPARQGLYRSVTWMNELLLSQKEREAEDAIDSYGAYSSLEYQFARQWSVFGRYDFSQFPDDNDSHENACTGGLTFAQSEFAFWRAQFTHTDGEGSSATGSRDEFFLQLDFGIGPHRAHQY